MVNVPVIELKVWVALIGDGLAAGREVDDPGLMTDAGNVRRAVGLREA